MFPRKEWISVLLLSISALATIIRVVHVHLSKGDVFLNSLLPRMKQTIFKCERRGSLVKNYHRHDFLQDRPFQFNSSFKNPCWYENSSLKCLPYFFVMGIRKSGTTFLYSVIIKHPDVIHWGGKETQFFGHGQEQQVDGSHDINTFVQFFAKASQIIQQAGKKGANKNIIGDGSICTIYLNYQWRFYPGNENRSEPEVTSLDYVHHFLPGAKIILVFRDPVDRLYSEYYFVHGRLLNGSDVNPQTFHTYVTELVAAFEHCLKTRTVRQCVYDNRLLRGKCINLQLGIYYIYWLELRRLYKRDQILVLRYSELNQTSTLRKVFSFLEVADLPDRRLEKMMKVSKSNTRFEKYIQLGPVLNTTRLILKRFYRQFNERMANLMNDPYFLFE